MNFALFRRMDKKNIPSSNQNKTECNNEFKKMLCKAFTQQVCSSKNNERNLI